jgi:hypothetical protein
MPAAWESAPLVEAASGVKPAWESAPLVEETQATQEAPEMSYPERALTGAAMFAGGLTRPGAPADVGVSMLRQAGADLVSGLAGIAGTVLPGPEGQGAEWVRKTQETLGGQPMTLGGRAAVAGLSGQIEPAVQAARAPGSYLAEQGVPALGIKPSEATRVAGAVLSGVPEAALGAVGMKPAVQGLVSGGKAAASAYRAAENRFARPPAPVSFGEGTPTPRGPIAPEMTPEARASRLSMGAAETPELAMVQASIDQAPATVKQSLTGIPIDEVNTTALERHTKAQSLPVPVPLTKGMATADSALFSEEKNLRAKLPALAERVNQYPDLFQQNIEAIRDQVAPDIYGRPTDNMLGKEAIGLYSAFDKNSRAQISGAYDAIKNALGGREMLVDSASVAQNAVAKMQAERAYRWLPEELKGELADLAQRRQIPFDEMDKLQSTLGRAIKGYQRQGKGNEAYAAGIFQREIANMPLVGEIGEIKTLSDAARSLAKKRFDLIDTDPAYKSVVDGVARADKFADKYIINAGGDGVARLLKTLEGTDANQVAKLAILKHLDDKTGTMTFAPGDRSQSINMTSKGYGNAFANLSDSGVLESVFTPEELAQLQNLGDVMSYTQRTGSGGYVNYSGTTVSAASDVFRQQAAAAGAEAADVALSAAGVPSPVVKFGKGVISTLANRKFLKDSLEPMAGIRKGKQ